MKTTVNRALGTFTAFIKAEEKYNQYTEFSTETDKEEIRDSLILFEKVFPGNIFLLCSMSHPDHELVVGGHCEIVCGYSSEQFKKMSISEYLQLIHEDDLSSVEQCFKFINKSEPYDPETHRFVMNYRILHKDGHYIHLHDEKIALKTKNNRYVYFSMLRNITSDEKFYQVKLTIFRQTKAGIVKLCTYNPRQEESLITARQNDIIGLIVKGYSNQEIADLLHVSLNTVKNHKQRLFKKTNVKSSVELVHFISQQTAA